jgi:hypothetical protein
MITKGVEARVAIKNKRNNPEGNLSLANVTSSEKRQNHVGCSFSVVSGVNVDHRARQRRVNRPEVKIK